MKAHHSLRHHYLSNTSKDTKEVTDGIGVYLFKLLYTIYKVREFDKNYSKALYINTITAVEA